MKIAKKYGIMGNVNKTTFFQGLILSILYKLYKSAYAFL